MAADLYFCSLKIFMKEENMISLTVLHLHTHANCCRSKLCLQTAKISSEFFRNNLLLRKNVNLQINEETFWQAIHSRTMCGS